MCYRVKWFFWLLVFGFTAMVFGQQSKDSPDDDTHKWAPLFRKQAGEYAITAEGANEPLELVEKPLLRWSQPIRGGAEGEVFLWTRDQVPAVIATFFVWPSPDGKQGVAHERHSLSHEPLVAKFRERMWRPPGKALEWHARDEIAPSEATAEKRLRQMRDFVESLKAHSIDRKNKKWGSAVVVEADLSVRES